MKLLFTEGIGASQTTTNAQDEKIPVYETKTAAETDLANLEVGQIVATKDDGSELSNPVDIVQDGNMRAVTSNAVADAISYSTNEVKTGGKWIDGKPIYRKTISCGALPNNTTKNVAHGINNLERVIKTEGYSVGTAGSAGSFIPVPYVSGVPMAMYVDMTNLVLQTSGTYSNYSDTYVTIEYTKTTD